MPFFGPSWPPLPFAPPCSLQRFLPPTAGDLHGLPPLVLVLAPHLRASASCLGSTFISALSPSVPLNVLTMTMPARPSRRDLTNQAACLPKAPAFRPTS